MSACSVPGCGRDSRALGLCRAHWMRQRRGYSVTGPIKERRKGSVSPGGPCSVAGCGKSSAAMGLCWAHYRRERMYGAEHLSSEPALKAQGGACAICGATDPGMRRQEWATDHDHVTGEVRGILCHGCNVGLGAFKDSVDRLQRAIRYLRQRGHGQRPLVPSAPCQSAGELPNHS